MTDFWGWGKDNIEGYCFKCNGPQPDDEMITVLCAKTQNAYHYCSEDCCSRDYDARNLNESIELAGAEGE